MAMVEARTAVMGALIAVIVFSAGIHFLDPFGDHSSSTSKAISDKYQDADFRFARTSAGPLKESPAFIVKPDASIMTFKVSYKTSDAVKWTITNPEGGREGGWTSETGPGSADEIQWIHDFRPAAGTWKMTVECEKGCEFAFGVYFNDAVAKFKGGLKDTYKDATAHFYESSSGATSKTYTFTVEPGSKAMRIRIATEARDGWSLDLFDASARQTNVNFQYKAYVDDFDFPVDVQTPRAGTWTLTVGCNQVCEFEVGVYVT